MLEECLASIERQSVRPGRVVVWDNGSRVPVAERLRPREGVEVFRSGSNLGFAGGMNAALGESRAPLVALVNNDVVLAPDWIARLAAEMDRLPRLAGVQSVILRPDGLVDGAGIDLSDGTIRQRGHGDEADRLSGSAWGVSATAALFRRQALDDVARETRIFDESLFAYYEDVELSARLVDAGWELRVTADALATHRGSASAGSLGREALKLRVRNRWLVHRMHPTVGRSIALLAEDVRGIAKALSRGRPAEGAARLFAVLRGMTVRI